MEIIKRENVKVGMFALDDGRFTPLPDDIKRVKGIVACVNHDLDVPKGQKGLLLTMDERQLTWEEAQKYCQSYDKHGVTKGEGFLLTTRQWLEIFLNKYLLNCALYHIKAKQLMACYWAKRERNEKQAWAMHSSFFMAESCDKDRTDVFVRCAVLF